MYCVLPWECSRPKGGIIRSAINRDYSSSPSHLLEPACCKKRMLPYFSFTCRTVHALIAAVNERPLKRIFPPLNVFVHCWGLNLTLQWIPRHSPSNPSEVFLMVINNKLQQWTGLSYLCIKWPLWDFDGDTIFEGRSNKNFDNSYMYWHCRWLSLYFSFYSLL